MSGRTCAGRPSCRLRAAAAERPGAAAARPVRLARRLELSSREAKRRGAQADCDGQLDAATAVQVLKIVPQELWANAATLLTLSTSEAAKQALREAREGLAVI